MSFEIPEGTKDLLPAEVTLKNQIETKLHKQLSSWGYRQVITPSYEYLTTLAQGEESRLDYFSFISESGESIALRNDFTTPIARLANVALAEEPRPLRLYYLGNLFRLQRKERKREFWQAGAELIGDGSPEADAEILALAMSSLEAIGIPGWGLDIGHRGILRGILNDSNLSIKSKQEVENLFLNKDYAELKALAKREKTCNDLLLLPDLRGDAKIINQAAKELSSPSAKIALAEIEEILGALSPYKINNINIDLAMVKDLAYYSGMFFEGFAPGLAGVICTGGRYDKLLGNFGKDEPAVGLAIGIDEVMEVLAIKSNKCSEATPDLCIVYNQENYLKAINIATEKRLKGESVFIASDANRLPLAKEYLKLI